MNLKPSLEAYLHGNALNITIYKQLNENYQGLFDPHEFFNFLYEWFDFFEKNQDNFFKIEAEFDRIELEDQHWCVFLFYLIEVIKYHHYGGQGDVLLFSEAAAESFKHLENMLNEIVDILYPKDNKNEDVIEDGKATASANPKQLMDIEEQLIESADDISGAGNYPTLKQKLLVIRYLEQFTPLRLNSIHGDHINQAKVLSFLINHDSIQTARTALGEDFRLLKTKSNLDAAFKLFEPLKAAFPQIVSQIEADIKNLKK